MTHLTAGLAPTNAVHEPAETLLDVQGLETGYGQIQVLHDINLRVGKGECVGVLGVNGAGKSTLLNALAGINRTWRGTIEFEGDEVTRQTSNKARRSGIALVAEGRDLFPSLTVEDNLRCGLVPFGAVRGKKADARLEELAELFPVLADRRDQLAGTLSGGEQQMVAIARALMGDVKLLLLDEPSLGLSPIIIDVIYERLETMAKSGLSMLLVEQHVDRALELAKHVYVMDLGRVVHSAQASELKDSRQLEAVYLGT